MRRNFAGSAGPATESRKPRTLRWRSFSGSWWRRRGNRRSNQATRWWKRALSSWPLPHITSPRPANTLVKTLYFSPSLSSGLQNEVALANQIEDSSCNECYCSLSFPHTPVVLIISNKRISLRTSRLPLFFFLNP